MACPPRKTRYDEAPDEDDHERWIPAWQTGKAATPNAPGPASADRGTRKIRKASNGVALRGPTGIGVKVLGELYTSAARPPAQAVVAPTNCRKTNGRIPPLS